MQWVSRLLDKVTGRATDTCDRLATATVELESTKVELQRHKDVIDRIIEQDRLARAAMRDRR